MPRAATTHEQDGEPVRVCAECRRAKSIRGVWYLVPGTAPAPFVCETCFAMRRALRATS